MWLEFFMTRRMRLSTAEALMERNVSTMVEGATSLGRSIMTR
ncbi:MAG: hypothetical protein A4E30_00657 [Methanomassiliicoccales archaeon PtaB.Bin215]|nr:MAG: hypothetical protein A4E30_00657 [Methanomassiliicoccales archaeon PtaB.Bin215]